ncbi:hypothetical protein M9458_043056, partial [Cirrhinus mrigala]
NQRHMEGKMWLSMQKARWLIFFTESKNRIMWPMRWLMQRVWSRTLTAHSIYMAQEAVKSLFQGLLSH